MLMPLVIAILAGGEAKVTPRPGDHLAIIGNTLADRMQRDGWFESMLYQRFPPHDLVVRNLGFSGDEVNHRLRSAGFGSPDEWLTRVGADLVFAFFGYGESFGDAAGLPIFRKELADFLEHTARQKYNGKSAPRIVLFSPIAQEDPKGRDLPDAKENNRRLALYTQAMAEVAQAHHVPFVDLFAWSQRAYSDSRAPLTINGIHLTEEGNRELALAIDRLTFGGEAPKGRDLVRLREAVLDKSSFWYERYRTVDGYSIFGGRADLKFVGGQTNRVVMQREMDVLDVMTANRDRRIWAIVKGDDIRVEDSNTPPFIPVISNKPGPLPGGKHKFLSGEEELATMTVGKGLKVNLYASEAEFPELINPVQMAWDTRGRLWVATWSTYPHWRPKEPMNDKLLIFEDTNGDGKADRCSTFADGLHCPTGFEFWGNGVLVAQAPELWLLEDADADGKADKRTRLLHGLDTADTHHTANSFTLDPGGSLYFQEGTFHHTQVESPYGPTRRCANGGVFRYQPRTQRFDVYVTYGFANPHGHVFDRWGQDFVYDGTGANPYHAVLFSSRLDYPQKHAQPPQVYAQRTRPCPGVEILSSRHFPDEMQGNLLVGNVIGFQGILRYKVMDAGSSFSAQEQEPILSSSDPNFRPSDLEMGPDGALYFTDWHNPIIGHMQHNLRDPNRDREHGRIYRVRHATRPLLEPVSIAGEPIDKLFDRLKEPEDRVRYRARIELSGRPSNEVIAAAKRWLDALDPKDADFPHHLLEALWQHQSHHVVDPALLDRALASPDFRVRAAATRVLTDWREQVPSALERLKQLAADPHPRVRLEAVWGASFFTEPEAIEVILVAEDHPTDRYLDFLKKEALRAIDPAVRRAIVAKQAIHFTTPAGARYFLKNVRTADLVKLERTAEVERELLQRQGVLEEYRKASLASLARREKTSPLVVLAKAISAIDASTQAEDAVLFDLFRLWTDQPATDARAARDQLEAWATSGKRALTRQLAFAALAATPDGYEAAWRLARASDAALADLVASVPFVRDPVQRANFYPKLRPFLEASNASSADSRVVRGRYVRIELPGKNRTLTLAEVEVESGGANIARTGKASQKNTANGGVAARGIDGNKSPNYSDGGQTHSEEHTTDPWWEVDLGRTVPIERVIVHNRADGYLGARLAGFSLLVLDGNRRVVFEQKNLAPPVPSLAVKVSAESAVDRIRRLSMNAIVSIRGKEAPTFHVLGRYVDREGDRPAAVAALLKLPAAECAPEDAGPIVSSLLAYLRSLPARERTGPDAANAQELASAIAGQLPREAAMAARRELGELGVRVLRLGTVTDQMRFDREQLAVQAGKPFEIAFENGDIMPHNVVLLEPGSLEEVGNLAESMATSPGAIERHYVPESRKILAASRLLAPRASQRLSLSAPARPGVYPYVCTYPGHWRRMYGALYVVERLDEYLANPEAYIASRALAPVDPLLKWNRPRKEWKVEDIAPAAASLSGRSFAAGKQMFQVANCIACHKLNGTGQEFGPDLAKLDPKNSPADVAKSVIDPSAKIDDKFASYSFELDSGQIVTGMILEETKDFVKVIENPLTRADARLMKSSEIISRQKQPTSLMPKGLLDKLTREEILDLLAYVLAKGDQHNAVFTNGHNHAAPSGGH